MCTGRSLIAGVARLAQLPYTENPVSGDLLGAREDVCAQAVLACGVRKCGVVARRESGQRHGCGEAVPVAAGGRRPLVGSPWQWCAHVREVCWWACGGGGRWVFPQCWVGHARPARFSASLPHMSLHCLNTSSSIYGSLEGQTQHKKVCIILLYLNRSEIIPSLQKICSEELIFSACTRHYFNRKRELVA